MQYELTLKVLPEASDPEGIRRLKRGIKTLFRAYRLRTVYVRRIEEGPGGGGSLSPGAATPGTACQSLSREGKDPLVQFRRLGS